MEKSTFCYGVGSRPGRQGQVVLLAGEAGIGKSRITQALRQRLSDEPHLRLRAQCLPYYSNSAFYPFIATSNAPWHASGTPRPPCSSLPWRRCWPRPAPPGRGGAAVGGFCSIPSGDRYALTLSPQRQKDKTIEALIDQVREPGAASSRCWHIFEDVH